MKGERRAPPFICCANDTEGLLLPTPLGLVGWCRVNFQCRGVLLIWIRVRQGPTALAVGAGGGCLDTFSLVFLPLSGGGVFTKMTYWRILILALMKYHGSR